MNNLPLDLRLLLAMDSANTLNKRIQTVHNLLQSLDSIVSEKVQALVTRQNTKEPWQRGPATQ